MRWRTALGNIPGRGVVRARALSNVLCLLAQQFLQFLLYVIKRIVPYKFVHPSGVLVEFLVQLVLLRQQSVKLAHQSFALLLVGLGQLRLHFFCRLTEFLLVFDQLLHVVHERLIFGLGVGQVGLLAQEIIVILHADDHQPHRLAASQVWLRCGVHGFGEQ